MNFVAEWTTMSAPHSIGRHRYGRREGVVDDQRQVVLVRDRRDRLDVEHVAARIADRLAEERLRVRLDGRAPGVQVIGVDPGQLDAHLAQQMC